ncbi:MAG: PQQ-dependent sugar dehydrogenase [Bacteroidota bacterium]
MRVLHCLFIGKLLFLFSLANLFAQEQLSENFTRSLVSENWNQAVGIVFDDSGRMYVWEKSGKVYVVVEGEKQLFLDISEEVCNTGDNGCLGFVLDPNFSTNGYVYLSYTVDRYHLDNFGKSSYDPTRSNCWAATIGRVGRWQADASNDFLTTLPESRKVLLGKTRAEGPPVMFVSHGAADLAFGTDGTLLVGMGEGAPWDKPSGGGGNYTGFEAEGVSGGFYPEEHDIGSFRAQLLESMAGKILRIDPETGEGIPSNPFFDGNDPFSSASRVWSLGHRNPFRMVVRPGTGSSDPAEANPGSLYMGDVAGGEAWEELNIQRVGGLNYGWPLYTGFVPESAYDTFPGLNRYAPNPAFGTGGCDQEFLSFWDLVTDDTRGDIRFPNPCDPNEEVPVSYPRFKHERASLIWRHEVSWLEEKVEVPGFDDEGKPIGIDAVESQELFVDQGFSGNAVVGGSFYTHNTFPSNYQESFLLADHTGGWIKAFHFDLNDTLLGVTPLYQDTFRITDLEVNPIDGCLYFIRYPSELHKICYGGNVPPIAIAEADTLYGPSPLTVQFDGSASNDPQEEGIRFLWEFGDGNTSTEINPTYTFETNSGEPTPFTVRLTVTDDSDQSSISELIVSLNNTPPQAEITSFNNGDPYPLGGTTWLPLTAEVADAEFTEEELSYFWETYLHHNTHYHLEETDTLAESHARIVPWGCGAETYYYRISLTVSDPAGLSTTINRFLYPDCVDAFVGLTTWELEPEVGQVGLIWESSREDSLAEYEVQWAPDGVAFESIGTVAATGAGSEYSFLHESPSEGLNDYRLRLIKQDGASYLSESRRTLFLSEWVRLYPNPGQDWIQVDYDAFSGNKIELELFTLQGQSLWYTTWDGTGGGTHRIALPDLQPGVYLYRIWDENHEVQGKWMRVGE